MTLEYEKDEIACILCGQFSIVKSPVVLIMEAAAYPMFPSGGSGSDDKTT